MALDSRSKRASSVNFLKPYALDLILPDGAIGQGDRQHIIWDYSGILAIAPVVIILTTPDDRIFSVPYDDRSYQVPFDDRTFEVKPDGA